MCCKALNRRFSFEVPFFLMVSGMFLGCQVAMADSPPRDHRIQNPPARDQLGVSGSRLSECDAGTLGSLVEDKPKKKFYILSNEHVLGKTLHEAIKHVGNIDTPKCLGTGSEIVAKLATYVDVHPGLPPHLVIINTVDAALAELELCKRVVNQVEKMVPCFSREIRDIGVLNPTLVKFEDVRKAMNDGKEIPVMKSGRTTGFTLGKVIGIASMINVRYGFLSTARFDNQYLVYGRELGDDIVEPGDSGSLFVTDKNDVIGKDGKQLGVRRPVGLLFARGLGVLMPTRLTTS